MLCICIICPCLFIYIMYMVFVICVFFLFWNRILICCRGWPGTHYEVKCSLRLTAILSLLSVCWFYITMLQFPYFIAPKGTYLSILKKASLRSRRYYVLSFIICFTIFISSASAIYLFFVMCAILLFLLYSLYLQST